MTPQETWVGEHCLALAHRWEPERLIVIFTGYFDEADTHSAEPDLIMAAYLGHAYQWARFEKKLSRIQQQYGFKVFHAKDFKAKSKEFQGWSDDKGKALIADLTELVRDNLTEGMSVCLEHARYKNEYRAPPIPKKMSLDSQYGVCFRACLGRILAILDARNNKDRLHVVMERGHKNVGDCERIFSDLKKRYARSGSTLFGDFTIASKEDCHPLMVADFLAAAHSMLRQAVNGRGIANYTDMAPPARQREGALAFLELRPDALTGLKSGFEAMRRAEAEEWRAKRDARRASRGGAR